MIGVGVGGVRGGVWWKVPRESNFLNLERDSSCACGSLEDMARNIVGKLFTWTDVRMVMVRGGFEGSQTSSGLINGSVVAFFFASCFPYVLYQRSCNKKHNSPLDTI